MVFQVQCINKRDRESIHEKIRFIGGRNADGSRWKFSQAQAISYINSDTHSFYVNVKGQRVKVTVAKSRFDNEYLKTEADNAETNNLLSLPECPA